MIDLLVAAGILVDGSGSAALPGSVAIRGDRIVAVLGPDDPEPPAVRRIDAANRVVTPGFVDVHEHSDVAPFVEPGMDSMLRQGVTTVVVGNCGMSAVPVAGASALASLNGIDVDAIPADWGSFAGYLDRIDEVTPAVNVAALVGHGTLRAIALGEDQRRPPDRREMAGMRQVLDAALQDGALGLSTGLIYVPGIHATTDEIADLAVALRVGGGIYASHVRAEGEGVFDAVSEAIEVGRRAGVPVHISHLKVEGRTMWGRAPELLELLDAARRSGADVTADQYPYTAWETELAAALPPWVRTDELPRVLSDRAATARLFAAMDEGEHGWESVGRSLGWDRVVLGSVRSEPSLTGRSIANLARERALSAPELVCRILLEDEAAGMVGHGMHEDDVRAIVSRTDVFVASDGVAVSPAGPLGGFAVHPRYYGTFPRVLGRYVRDERALPLEHAVRKMTSLPAERFGLAGRGRIEVGAFADLVVLDPRTVADRATFEAPHAYPEGIDRVIVNGRIAFDGAARERAGRALRRGEDRRRGSRRAGGPTAPWSHHARRDVHRFER